MTIHEPATFATDLLLAALGAFFVTRLRKDHRTGPAGKWWIRAMALMATSALAGGCYHAVAPDLPPAIEANSWRMVLWIICGLGFAMGMSLLRELQPSRGRRAWEILLGVKLAISCGIVLAKPEFVIAMADYGSAMLAWAIAALACKRQWSPAMLAGVGLSLLAGAVQQMQWGLHRHFNHNDLFHVVQAFALFAFYRAGKCLD
ncbi:hypothetical protein [Luteolibacter sp. Populi]|uniref:DUF6962 family protein n=1 Tax=Luteolibacter sp. Populi TaxID=3230487 RepID=UPI00346636F0